ncbi:MAG TPA: aminoglycoside adenylyltransferase domain-containing protein, partial [Ktedonobacterales bacterium]|nr:aminoglycoside adenylyltransferase domain-containing protein [Ktedonobacterales bacterium]
CGSYVGSGFDPDVSDIDLLAVLNTRISDETVASLRQMHLEIERRYPKWRDRIEVVYVNAADLGELRTAHGRMAVISPGEALHVKEMDGSWILVWYPARIDAIALVGPLLTGVIPQISEAEYLAALRKHLRRFRTRIDSGSTPGDQAYAVLSMCRGLRTLRHHDRLSKAQAARWAEAEFPQWAGLIREAEVWRTRQWERPQTDGSSTLPRVQRFVTEILVEVEAASD